MHAFNQPTVSKSHKSLKAFLLILLLGLLIFTAYTAYEEAKNGGVCMVVANGVSDCNSVQNSEYNSIFGIKLLHLGTIAFTALILLYLATLYEHTHRNTAHTIFVWVSLLGSAMALYLIFLQVAVLKALCSFCIIVDVTMLLITLLGYIDHRAHKN